MALDVVLLLEPSLVAPGWALEAMASAASPSTAPSQRYLAILRRLVTHAPALEATPTGRLARRERFLAAIERLRDLPTQTQSTDSG